MNKPSVSLQLNSQKTLRRLTKLSWTGEEKRGQVGERAEVRGEWGGFLRERKGSYEMKGRRRKNREGKS